MLINYTIYKNPVFWLVNSRCIFRVFSYLGLISFIFAAAGVFAIGFNSCLPLRASNRQIHSEYFFFTFIRKVTWLIKFETRKCSEVKDLTFFPSAVVFAKTYFTCLPSRAANRQIHSEYFNHCLTKQIEYSWKRQAKGIINTVRQKLSTTWLVLIISFLIMNLFKIGLLFSLPVHTYLLTCETGYWPIFIYVYMTGCV
jgi:hypothetical protein